MGLDTAISPEAGAAAPGAAGAREAALVAELAAARRLQARYVFLLDLSDALRALAEPRDIKAAACALLGRHLGLSRVAYVEFVGGRAAVDGDFLAGGAHGPRAPDPVGAGAPPGPALRRWLRTACGDVPLVLEDAGRDPRPDADARDDLRRLGTAAIAVVRVARGGRAPGWLELHASRACAWPQDVLELQVQVADRIAVAVQRARGESELRSSEARLELAAASADVGVYDYDVVGGGVIWDARVRAIWGFGPDEPFTYDAFLASMHPEDRVQADRATARALDPAGDGRYAAEYRVLNRRDGSTRWVAANGQVFFEQGRPVRLVGTIQDVSRRKSIETTLRAFYEVSPLMMGTVERLDDGDMLHLYDNPATSRFFGVEPGSTAGRRARALGAPESVIGIWRRHYDEAGRHGAPVSFEYAHESGEGPPRLLAVTVAPLGPLSTSGGPTYCYVAEDVTERRAAERQLAAAVAELERADRAKDEFLATLSHELRNPLAPIRTAAQLLSSPRITPGQLQWAQSVIQRQVAHMAWLLDDLLDVARITQGKLVLKTERVALTSIVDAAVESARPQVDGRSHQLLVDLPDTAPVLEADPLRLAQVISNLLTNAAKYTDPGGRIELAAGLESGWLVVRVRDNGIGIPPEAQARIFDMFSQVEGVAGRAEGGLGIGLALVRGLVTLHGGTVAVHSEGPGRGSEFVVRLPLGEGAADELDAAGEPGPPRPGRGRRILVADDNRDAADMLALYLGMEGHEVRVAHSGRAALALAHAFRPDVALLDIGMPELDGYQVAEALRREAWARGLRLIAITGWGQDEDRRRAHAAGFDAHMTKPVDPEALAALIDPQDPPR